MTYNDTLNTAQALSDDYSEKQANLTENQKINNKIVQLCCADVVRYYAHDP